jgi:hypothetical protein
MLVLANVSFAGTAIVPTTTLNAELGNNTSASDYFTAKSNGNLGVGNVSDVSVKSLLYSGATTKVYAHVMPWFGGSNHMNVGYASNDPVQVREQVAAMRARGIDGVIIDWYGRNFSREDQATYYFKQEGERLGGSFKFAVMEDVGALRNCAATKGCSVTTEMISDLRIQQLHEVLCVYEDRRTPGGFLLRSRRGFHRLEPRTFERVGQSAFHPAECGRIYRLAE